MSISEVLKWMGTGRILDRLGMSILGGIQNFTGQSPEQSDPVGFAKSLDSSVCGSNRSVCSGTLEGETEQGGAEMEVSDGSQREGFGHERI